MKKKSIIFLADSTVDLMGLYEILSSRFNIIWVVYHKGVYDDLKKKNIKNVYLSNLSLKILNSKNIFHCHTIMVSKLMWSWIAIVPGFWGTTVSFRFRICRFIMISNF